MPGERGPESSGRPEAAQRALNLAARGEIEAAFRIAVSGGALDVAAEILARQARPLEAAQMALLSLGPAVAGLGRAAPQARDLADRAVAWLRTAGQGASAAELERALIEGLGERPPAVEAGLSAAGPPADEGTSRLLPLCRGAAQLAEQWNRTADGARLLESIGALGEAALAWAAAGDKPRSLATLMRVPSGNDQYRPACVRAAALAVELDESGIVLEQFLSRFVRTGPLSQVEVEAFYRLALLYERHNALGNAEEALRRLTAIRPDYRDAQAALRRVAQARRSAPTGAQAILAEEQAFHRPVRRARGEQPEAVPAWREGQPGYATGPLTGAGPMPGLPFAEGAVVADRYRIQTVIGRGGMSIVFEAADLELDDVVALKVFIHPIQGEELVKRFKREMQLSRQLQHGNILRLHDLGTHLGYRFVSMERLTGSDLRHRLEMAHPPLVAAVDYLMQAAYGLEAAHAAGVVHRDIKPENLFVTDGGVLKIMDFGIARVMSAPNVTQGGVIWGTPRYMSPEQIKSFSNVTAASDLYSLGIVAYELAVGHVPFDHPDLTELLILHLRDTPLRPRELKPEIPPGVDQLIMELLQKDPARRPASARECAERLRALR